MRRAGRWLRDAVTTLSLMVWVALVALWVRGASWVDCLELDTPYHVACVIAGESRLHLAVLRLAFGRSGDVEDGGDGGAAPAPTPGWHLRRDATGADDPYEWCAWAAGPLRFGRFGFGVRGDGHPPMLNSEGPVEPNGWEVYAPLPFLVAVTMLLPGLAVVRVVRRRRMRDAVAAGLCSACAYDLRETPARCPECGTPAAQRRRGGGR